MISRSSAFSVVIFHLANFNLFVAVVYCTSIHFLDYLCCSESAVLCVGDWPKEKGSSRTLTAYYCVFTAFVFPGFLTSSIRRTRSLAVWSPEVNDHGRTTYIPVTVNKLQLKCVEELEYLRAISQENRK